MRQQAAREINWHTPHRLSFDDDVPLLSVISEFGLQPSVAPLEEPNVDFRWTGRANIHETSPRHGH